MHIYTIKEEKIHEFRNVFIARLYMYFKSVKLFKTIYTIFLIQTTFYHVYYYDIPPNNRYIEIYDSTISLHVRSILQ